MAATVLLGNEWYGDVAPTTGVLPGQSWVQPTSGQVWRRDAGNTQWIPFGNINSSLGGAVSAGGDTMTGPLLDVPNLPPIADPDFQGVVYADGFPLATQLMLAKLQQSLRQYINDSVRAQFLSQTKLSGTAADIAFSSQIITTTVQAINSPTGPPGTTGGGGSLGTGVSIPLPIFQSDNLQATRSQVLGYNYAIAGFASHGAGADWNVVLFERTVGSMVLYGWWSTSNLPSDVTQPIFIATTVLAVR